MKAMKCRYEGVIEPAALYFAEACGLRSGERRKVKVIGKVGWSVKNE